LVRYVRWVKREKLKLLLARFESQQPGRIARARSLRRAARRTGTRTPAATFPTRAPRQPSSRRAACHLAASQARPAQAPTERAPSRAGAGAPPALGELPTQSVAVTGEREVESSTSSCCLLLPDNSRGGRLRLATLQTQAVLGPDFRTQAVLPAGCFRWVTSIL
jgi:hypothetical protein